MRSTDELAEAVASLSKDIDDYFDNLIHGLMEMADAAEATARSFDLLLLKSAMNYKGTSLAVLVGDRWIFVRV